MFTSILLNFTTERFVSIQNASVEKKGEQFMTSEDFIRGYLGMQAERNYNADTMKLLAGVVDQTKDG